MFGITNSPELRRQKLIERLGVRTVLDVGANEGQYARALRDFCFSGKIFSFEPIPEAFHALKKQFQNDPAFDAFECALGPDEKEISFNVAGNSVSSSVLAMEQLHEAAAPHSAYVRTLKVPMKRLDQIEALKNLKDTTLLKIDVQGFEKGVLEGAKNILPRIVAMELELSLRPLYQGAPNYSEIISYAHDLGFRLFYLDPGFMDEKSGELYQLNGTFIKRD